MFESSKLAKKYGIKCGGPSGRMARFAEPCLLFFLSQEASCGYELMKKINRFGFEETRPDPAMVYRMLCHLEKDKYILSKWETGQAGPAKKNYTITPKGLGLLHAWARTIKMRKQVLDIFLAQYQKHFKREITGPAIPGKSCCGGKK